MEYVILDIETTGLDIAHCSVIEVAAIRIVDGFVKEEFSSLVHYKGELSQTIKQLTGITEDMLTSAPVMEEAIPQLKSFIQKLPVVAHNGFSFDFPILERLGVKFAEKYDSMEFAFFVLPVSLVGHSISGLAEHFKLGTATHRALGDCKMEFAVILNLAKEFTNKAEDKKTALKYLSEKINWWWAHLLSTKSEYINSIVDLVKPHEPYRKRDPQQDMLDLGGQQIELSEVEKCFVPTSIITNANSDYSEDRPEQRKMALTIAESFNNKVHCVVEAGTGTGKSKAYLVPSLLFAQRNQLPIIISTHTKALQDQLYLKEINHLRDILDPDLRVTVIKGKHNYVCLKKFEEFGSEILLGQQQRSLYEFAQSGTEFTSRLAFLLLASWVLETERGDWDELPYWLKNRFPKRVELDLCNVDELCVKGVCENYDNEKCFLIKAKLRARDADIVIANHAVVLSGIIIEPNQPEEIVPEESLEDRENAGDNPYSHAIFPNEARYLVIDEAHHLEDDATSAWEHIISLPLFEKILLQLFGPKGVIKLMEIVAKQEESEITTERLQSYRNLQGDTNLIIQNLFEEILPQLMIKKESLDGYSSYLSFQELSQTPGHMKILINTLSNIQDRLVTIISILNAFSQVTDTESFAKTFSIMSKRVYSITKSLAIIVQSDQEYVRYIEKSNKYIEIKAGLLSVAKELNEAVYKNFSSVIFTSATLTVDKKFNFFADRCGLTLIEDGGVKYHLFQSSFDYEKQVKFFVPRGLRYKDGKEKHFKDSVQFLEQALIASNGGALILCSSHGQVESLYRNLLPKLAQHNIWLLRQEKKVSVSSVVRDFTKDINSVLIGTASLWQGIDVPGESLRTLVIYKIPYLMPGAPILKARWEAIDLQGRNGYAEYYEPLAALSLKQGFGRLIRKATDKGIAIMLEQDLLNKPLLLSSLPEGVSPKLANSEEIIKALEAQTHSV